MAVARVATAGRVVVAKDVVLLVAGEMEAAAAGAAGKTAERCSQEETGAEAMETAARAGAAKEKGSAVEALAEQVEVVRRRWAPTA